MDQVEEMKFGFMIHKMDLPELKAHLWLQQEILILAAQWEMVRRLIVVAGGYNGTKLDSVEIYDPTDNTWYSGKSNSLLEKITYINLIFSNEKSQNV